MLQVAGPKLWTSLPASLRQSDMTICEFKRLLFAWDCESDFCFIAPCIDVISSAYMIHAYIHTYIHIYTHTYIHTPIHTYTHT